MQVSRRRAVAILGGAVLSGCTAIAQPNCSLPTPADPAAAWPLPDRDAGNTNAAPASAGPGFVHLTQQWSTELGAGLSRPLVADGTVFVRRVDRTVTVYALDAATGDVEWTRTLDAHEDRIPSRQALASASQPAVGAGTVYLTVVHSSPFEDRNRSSWVYALNRTSGEPEWYRRRSASTRPIVIGETVLLGSGRAVLGLRADSGTVCFRADVQGYLDRLGGPEQTVIHLAVGSDHVYVVSRVTGTPDKPYWIRAIGLASGREEWVVRRDAWARAIAVANDTVYLQWEYTGGWEALDAVSGERKWRYGVGQRTDDRIAVDTTIACVFVDGSLVGLDPVEGAALWRQPTGLPPQTIVGDLVLYPLWEGRDGRSAIRAIHTASGEVLQTTELERAPRVPVIASGRLFGRTTQDTTIASWV